MYKLQAKIISFFLFSVLGFWAQGLTLARQLLYQKESDSFCLSYFSDRFLCILLRPASNHNPFTYASHVAGITDMYHKALLIFFCLSWPQTLILLSLPPKYLGLQVWATMFGHRIFSFLAVLAFELKSHCWLAIFLQQLQWIKTGIICHYPYLMAH
jgi:hypothetical protein